MESLNNRIPAALVVVLIAWLLSGCATNPVTGGLDFVLMSEEQEIILGDQVHKDVLKRYDVYRDAELGDLVRRIGGEIAAHSHRSELEYTFTVLDSPEVNAFATPGGYVYTTRGIIAYMNNEEQLAGVLGHEIGHVTARHSVRQHSAQAIGSAAAGLLGAAVATTTGDRDAGQMVDLGLGQFGRALVSGYGRAHELEADRLGAQYLAAVGYDPEKMLGVVGILKDQEAFELRRAREEGRPPRVYHGLFATHPRNDERLKEVIRAADRYRVDKPRVTDPDAFLRMLDGLDFGDSARQGILRGNAFYHGPLDLFIRFPVGWQVTNSRERLLAIGPGQDQAMVLQLVPRGDAATPEGFLRRNFRNLRQGRPVGSHGYTAIADSQDRSGVVTMRVAAALHGDRVLILSGLGKNALPDRQVLDAAGSIRRLESAERGIAAGHRIRLVRAKPGDTFAGLARRSPLGEFAEEQLRLLNGMFPEGEPAPGQLLKIIR